MIKSKYINKNLILSVLLVAVYLLLQIVTNLVTGNRLVDQLNVNSYEIPLESISIEIENENIVQLENVEQQNGEIWITLLPVQSGETSLRVQNKVTGEDIQTNYYRVTKDNTIIDEESGNFSHYQLSRIYISLLLLIMTIRIWGRFTWDQKFNRYSYNAIFHVGLGIWLTFVDGFFWYCIFTNSEMLEFYSTLQSSMFLFMMCSFPLCVIFALSLSVSNISLIRHEGFSFTNVLGILLSIMMVGGVIGIGWVDSLLYSGSDFQISIYLAIINSLSSIYCLCECFLAGSIICGISAAKHIPAYDKDYIVILGCQMRADGTLYPLLRGRVDKAISFQKQQLQSTGKKAAFVVSGGQGPNEPISEAEAMSRYLLQQGYEKSDILLENQSTNTLENMSFSKKIITQHNPEAKVAFSTTNYHVFRSGIIASQADFKVDGMGSTTKWYFWPNAFVREVIGMMSYKWKSLVLLLIPIVCFFVAIQFML